jgi:prepilin peptidase CpaA
MTTFQISGLTTIVLLVAMISAVVNDVKENRIPNQLVLMVICLGLVSQLSLNGVVGLAYWLGGAAVGFVIFLPFYMRGGMGAGDVKLMAATGGVLGVQGGIVAGVLALAAGLPIALIIVLHRYLLNRRSMNLVSTAGTAGNDLDQGEKIFSRATREQRIPYAAAIAAGAVGGLWWNGNLPNLAGVL